MLGGILVAGDCALNRIEHAVATLKRDFFGNAALAAARRGRARGRRLRAGDEAVGRPGRLGADDRGDVDRRSRRRLRRPAAPRRPARSPLPLSAHLPHRHGELHREPDHRARKRPSSRPASGRTGRRLLALPARACPTTSRSQRLELRARRRRSPHGRNRRWNAVNERRPIEASGRLGRLRREHALAGYASSDTDLYATRHVSFATTSILDDGARRTNWCRSCGRSGLSRRDHAGLPSSRPTSERHARLLRAVGDTWLSRTVPLILGSPGSRAALAARRHLGRGTATTIRDHPGGHGRRGLPVNQSLSTLSANDRARGLRPLTANDAGAATMEALLK